MDCPKCSGTLAEETFGGVGVDRCDSCQGIWFDAKEVRALIAHAKSKPDEVPQSTASPASEKLDDANGTCPRCQESLHRVESLAIEGLHYDQCMSCRGAWLDAGELAQIVDSPGADEELKFFNEFD
jgi:Zn-finger nucleic acid-binding protein